MHARGFLVRERIPRDSTKICPDNIVTCQGFWKASSAVSRARRPAVCENNTQALDSRLAGRGLLNAGVAPAVTCSEERKRECKRSARGRGDEEESIH